MNADYFILIGTFTVGDCQYSVERFLSSLNACVLHQLIKHMNKNGYKFLWTDRDELICLGFKKQITLIKMSGTDTFLVKKMFKHIVMVY